MPNSARSNSGELAGFTPTDHRHLRIELSDQSDHIEMASTSGSLCKIYVSMELITPQNMLFVELGPAYTLLMVNQAEMVVEHL